LMHLDMNNGVLFSKKVANESLRVFLLRRKKEPTVVENGFFF